MHAKRQGWLISLFDAMLVVVLALFAAVRFLALGPKPKHAKAAPLRSKHWGLHAARIATTGATLALLGTFGHGMW